MYVILEACLLYQNKRNNIACKKTQSAGSLNGRLLCFFLLR